MTETDQIGLPSPQNGANLGTNDGSNTGANENNSKEVENCVSYSLEAPDDVEDQRRQHEPIGSNVRVEQVNGREEQVEIPANRLNSEVTNRRPQDDEKPIIIDCRVWRAVNPKVWHT